MNQFDLFVYAFMDYATLSLIHVEYVIFCILKSTSKLFFATFVRSIVEGYTVTGFNEAALFVVNRKYRRATPKAVKSALL